MLNYQTLKLHIVAVTGLERDALHIYVGIGLFLIGLLVSRAVIKRQLTRLNVALVFIILIACLGEFLDLNNSYPYINQHIINNSIHDVINTCFWPFVLYATARWTSLLA